VELLFFPIKKLILEVDSTYEHYFKDVEIVVTLVIEGGKYAIPRSLVPSGLACSLDLLILEYHSLKVAKGTVLVGIDEVMNWILEGNNC
jgi:hypothetical protein